MTPVQETITVNTPVFVQRQGETISVFAYVWDIADNAITFIDSDFVVFTMPRRLAERNTKTVQQFAMQVYKEMKVA